MVPWRDSKSPIHPAAGELLDELWLWLDRFVKALDKFGGPAAIGSVQAKAEAVH
jgi:hypothetical protein